jgi:hypothetical protein
MPIKVEIIGDTPGQANIKIVGLAGAAPGPGQMRLLRANSKTSLGADRGWHAEEQWLPLPELFTEGNALIGRVGPEVVDPLALLGPSDVIGMTVRLDGRSEDGRVKTDKLFGSHLRHAEPEPPVPPVVVPPLVAEPVTPPTPPVAEPPPVADERPLPPSQSGASKLPLIAAAVAAVLLAGGAGAYFMLKDKPAAEIAKAETAKPEEVKTAEPAAPGEINTREDLAKFIQATPEADKAFAQARALADKGKLDFAMLLFQHAARGGSNDASVAVARMYDPETWSAQTSPMPQADAETAAYWYEPAAQGGNVEAQRQLGKIMAELTPSGFQHDKGREWLQKAATAGDAKAKELLEKIK